MGLTPRQDLKATSVTRILQSIAPASLQVNRSVGSSCVDQYLLDKDPFSPKSIRYVPELPVRSQSRLRHHGSGSARFAHRVLQQKPKGIRQTYSTILVRKKFKTFFNFLANFLIFSCHVQRSCQTALSFLDGESLQPKVLLQTESSLNSKSTCVHPFFCLAYILLNPIFKLYQFFLFFSHPLILQTLLSAAFKRAPFFERVTRGRFEAGLKLPVLPEEVYNGNRMVFEHVKSGERIEVSNEPPPLLHHGSCTPCTTVMSDSRCTGNVQRACVRHTVAHTN